MPTPERRNVLMIACHDLNTHLGCYGNPIVQTPNLDRLAARGLAFARNYCAYPLCGPSRASLLTGRRPDTTRVFSNRVWFRDTLPTVSTLPRLFRENGYWTGSAGTFFHGRLDDEQAWCEGHKPYETPPAVHDPEFRKAYRLRADMHQPADEPDETFVDVQTARTAVEMLRRHRSEPFFIGAGFVKPHVPLVAPQSYFDLYDVDNIPLPPLRPADAPAVPEQSWRPNFDIFVDREISDEEARHAILAYYACTSFMDAQVGAILDTLDDLDLWKDTVVVFWVDHGFHLGDKGFWSKMTLYDPSTRVPLIVAVPGMAHPGGTVRGLTENVDLFQTLVELCGLPVPEWLEGTSFVPLLADTERPWKRTAFSQLVRGNSMGRMARSERWHYVRWGKARPEQEELYDCEADPDQLTNLAQSPAHSAVLAEMRAQLDSGWKAGQPF